MPPGRTTAPPRTLNTPSIADRGIAADRGTVVAREEAEHGGIKFGSATTHQPADGRLYLKDNDIAHVDDRMLPVTADLIPSDAASHALDPETADRLWDMSQRMLLSS